jgi:hypothetical protein
LKMAITEYIRIVDRAFTEHGLWEHSSACQ